MTEAEAVDRLAETDAVEGEDMAILRCSGCDHWNSLDQSEQQEINYERAGDYLDPRIRVTVDRPDSGASGLFGIEAVGIITCLRDNHRMAFRLLHGDPATPARLLENSADLSPRFEADFPGLKQDVEEAETCHAAQSYKGAVVLCRRAMQLSIIECGIADAPLTNMLGQIEQHLSPATYALAQSVKNLGDQGAHRLEEINEPESATMIWAAVKVLNELEPHMQQPASQ